MDNTLDVVEVDPKATVVAIYSATEAEIGRRIEQYAKVVPDCSNKDGIEFAKTARAAFREPRLLIEEIRVERKKPYLEIGRLIDSEAKRITALVAPHEKTWDDAIKADELRKENEKREKAQAEIRRVDAIRKKINSMERAPIDALTLTSAGILAVIELMESTVIDELYAEFEDEARSKMDAALSQLRSLHSSRVGQEAAKALADAAQKKLDDERAAFQAQKEADEKILAEQREALLKQQRELQEANAQAERNQQLAAKLEAAREVQQATVAGVVQQAFQATEAPKPVLIKSSEAAAANCVDLLMLLRLARRDAKEFRNKYARLDELSFVIEEIDSFMAATEQLAEKTA